MRYVGLTEGHYNLGAPVRLKPGTGLMGGQGDQDTPGIIQYQEGTDPTFPLVIGTDQSQPDLTCPDCGLVLGQAIGEGQLRSIYLSCPNGGGLDYL